MGPVYFRLIEKVFRVMYSPFSLSLKLSQLQVAFIKLNLTITGNMKFSVALSFIAGFQFSLASLSSDCNPSTFEPVLPSNATLIYAIPYPDNSTFDGSINNLPAICALYVNVTSSDSSAFEFGLWLPIDTWNDRFIAYGNGGFIGEVAFDDMSTGLGYGFAAVSTNTGHNSSMMEEDGVWALNQPEKQTDWGWRALHGSVELGKTPTEEFYGSSIDYSYYAGCSTGGRQGLKSLQMFPDDFDGVLAGLRRGGQHISNSGI